MWCQVIFLDTYFFYLKTLDKRQFMWYNVEKNINGEQKWNKRKRKVFVLTSGLTMS